MQTTINEWLHRKNGTDKKIRKYFYLEWKEGELIPNKCIFMKTIPEKYNFKYKFKWNLIFYNIEIYGNLPKKFLVHPQNSEGSHIVSNKNFLKNDFKQNKFMDNRNIISCLKSHLQKCVRKKLLGKAIYTADYYMSIDVQDFLRRLTIIMIEDTFFHSSFMVLLWFMISFQSKEIRMNNLIRDYFLGVVYFMINEAKYRETYYLDNERNNFHDLIFDVDNCAKDEYVSYIYAILIRKSFGGMEGDIKMLEKCGLIWYHRLMRKDLDDEVRNYLEKQIRPITIYKDVLKMEDWELTAIDFHTHPNMIKWIMEKNEAFEEEEIKEAIWYYQSGVNYRKFYNQSEEYIYNKKIVMMKEKYANVWNSIQKDLYSIRKYLLKKLYEDIENTIIIH
jgi:hypothetical protein